jgi:hypothetical protein
MYCDKSIRILQVSISFMYQHALGGRQTMRTTLVQIDISAHAAVQRDYTLLSLLHIDLLPCFGAIRRS